MGKKQHVEGYESTATRLKGMIIDIMLAKTPEAQKEARQKFNDAVNEVIVQGPAPKPAEKIHVISDEEELETAGYEQ